MLAKHRYDISDLAATLMLPRMRTIRLLSTTWAHRTHHTDGTHKLEIPRNLTEPHHLIGKATDHRRSKSRRR
jgi:hypothetical protein